VSAVELAMARGLEEVRRLDDDASGLRTRGVIYERVRPVRWLWTRRIPCGLPSLLVGEEGVGKGTAVAWLVAKATCGQLEGDLKDEPARVLIVGDEDAFEPIWVPRLYAANADLTKVRTLDDEEYLDDLAARADDLAATIRHDEIGLVLFDQLLDHIYGGREGQAIYNPKSVRQSMLPLRRVAASTNVALLGLMHPIKGRVSSFRQLIAGSHQFNAVSRSSLLLGVDPADESRRVLVRGKGNHSAIPRSFEFAIAAEDIELNGHRFEVPKVVREAEGDPVDDLLSPAPIRTDLVGELRGELGREPRGTGELAVAVGRDAKDGSVRNALAWLVEQGEAEKVGRGQWKAS
jgi:AAA domain